jgi:hyperosmotically inducible protein
MKPLQSVLFIGALIISGTLGGCSASTTKSPDVAGSIRQSLNNSGLKDVSVSQNRDKGVVTLTGHVAGDAEKSQAQSVAASLAQGQVVANEIVVTPRGVEGEARDINSDVDKGIRSNLDAALVQNGLNKVVKYEVKNGVITLTGEVISESLRKQAAQLATSIPYQQQVVNELQVKSQKATSY